MIQLQLAYMNNCCACLSFQALGNAEMSTGRYDPNFTSLPNGQVASLYQVSRGGCVRASLGETMLFH